MQNAFNKLLQKFSLKLLNGIFYWPTNCLPACLMPSDQHNTTMAKATCLIFSTVQHHFGLRGAFWHTAVCTIHSSWIYLPVPSFVFCSSLLKVKSVNSVVAHDGSLFAMEKIVFFILATLITQLLFKHFSILTGLNTAGNKG